MRVVTFIFALMLVMGLSFGGASLVGTHAAFADDKVEGEMPGGEMADDAAGNAQEAAEDAAGDAADAAKDAMGETPGGEMPDDAAK